MSNHIAAKTLRLWLDVSEESQAEQFEQTNLDKEVPEDQSGGAGASGGKGSDDDTAVIGSEDPDPLPKDVRFDILKNRRRRLVLRYAMEHENPVTIGALAEHVAAIENDKDVAMLNSRERKRAYVGLYQCHLPRMHDAGVIEFDQNRGMVSLGVHAEELLDHLGDDEAESDTYPWLYAALSTVGTGAFLISQSTMFDAAAFGTFVVGLVLASFVVTAFWQLYNYQNPDENRPVFGSLESIPYFPRTHTPEEPISD